MHGKMLTMARDMQNNNEKVHPDIVGKGSFQRSLY